MLCPCFKYESGLRKTDIYVESRKKCLFFGKFGVALLSITGNFIEEVAFKL